MYFKKHHPEDKRVFSVVLAAAIILFGFIGFAIVDVSSHARSTEPRENTAKVLSDTQQLLNDQRDQISDDYVVDSLNAIEQARNIQALKEKIENQN